MSTKLYGPTLQVASAGWNPGWPEPFSIFEFQFNGNPPSGPHGPDISAEIAAIKGKKLKILVVDDDPAFGKATKRWLKQKFGAEVDYAESGAEAIEAIDRSSYDCIFLDLMMDGMSGVETFERLQDRVAKERFVAMSADKGGPEWIKAQKAGLEPIKKPFIEEPEMISHILNKF